ncbi:hypothetical protein [Streptomyces asiaticus]|uniref:hypothetical protein n=1 Tax=Streptomyces asiaticus TaxID=114695 RepID=UPI003F67EA6E
MKITACDIDMRVPAKTYTITVSDGRSVSKDLCEEHAGCLEDLLEEVEVGKAEAESEPEVKREAEVKPEATKAPARKAPARKAPAKKATAKKATASRRRPKIMTLEQIEESKKDR